MLPPSTVTAAISALIYTLFHYPCADLDQPSVNQECQCHLIFFADGSLIKPVVYAMAQASRAILPKDVGGPWGQRIGVSIGGGSDWALVVGAYVTERVLSTDWDRYSLVVLNWFESYFRVEY